MEDKEKAVIELGSLYSLRRAARHFEGATNGEINLYVKQAKENEPRIQELETKLGILGA